MLIPVNTRDGDIGGYSLRSVMDYCRERLEAAGFKAEGFSSQSESVYFKREGFDGELRVAFHANGRGGYAANLILPRAEIWGADGREPVLPYPHDASDLDAMIAEAIAEFDGNAEPVDENEDA